MSACPFVSTGYLVEVEKCIMISFFFDMFPFKFIQNINRGGVLPEIEFRTPKRIIYFHLFEADELHRRDLVRRSGAPRDGERQPQKNTKAVFILHVC